MADQIAEIKSKVDIAQLINERVPLKQRGRRFLALCPFHSEKTPSFTVSPDLGIFKCFGCNKAGDIFTFLQEYEGMSFVEALEYLADKTGVKLERRAVNRHTAAIDQKIYEINHLAAEYFHYLLTKHRVGERGRKYLKSRGIAPAAIDNFFLGYALNRWDGLYKFLTKKGYEPQLLETAGLIVSSSAHQPTNSLTHFYDRFRGRVIFPLRDPRGQVVGFAGRIVDQETRPSELQRSGAKYINSPETPVYAKRRHLYGIFENREEIRRAGRAVLVEGELDAISSWQAGVKNILAIKGTALTDDQAKLIRRYSRNVNLCLDADSAGEEALKRSLPILERHRLNARVIALPAEVKDPDDLAREKPEEWRKLAKSAISLYQALINQTILRIGSGTGEEKKRVSEALVPVLSEIQNAVEQEHWINKLSSRLKVSAASVRREINHYRSSAPAAPPATPRPPASSRPEILSRYLLALIIQGRVPTTDSLNFRWLEPINIRKIFRRFRDQNPFLSADKTSSSPFPGILSRFRQQLPPELHQIFDTAATQELAPSPDSAPDSKWVKKEIDQTLKELEKVWIKLYMRRHAGQPEKIAALSRRLNELNQPS